MKTRQEMLALLGECVAETNRRVMDEGERHARDLVCFCLVLSWVLEEGPPLDVHGKAILKQLDAMVIRKQNRHAESN